MKELNPKTTDQFGTPIHNITEATATIDGQKKKLTIGYTFYTPEELPNVWENESFQRILIPSFAANTATHSGIDVLSIAKMLTDDLGYMIAMPANNTPDMLFLLSEEGSNWYYDHIGTYSLEVKNFKNGISDFLSRPAFLSSVNTYVVPTPIPFPVTADNMEEALKALKVALANVPEDKRVFMELIFQYTNDDDWGAQHWGKWNDDGEPREAGPYIVPIILNEDEAAMLWPNAEDRKLTPTQSELHSACYEIPADDPLAAKKDQLFKDKSGCQALSQAIQHWAFGALMGDGRICVYTIIDEVPVEE